MRPGVHADLIRTPDAAMPRTGPPILATIEAGSPGCSDPIARARFACCSIRSLNWIARWTPLTSGLSPHHGPR